MKCRAVIKKTGGWWIGWLVDLPGVNAQEMLATEITFEPGSFMTTISVPDPEWAASAAEF